MFWAVVLQCRVGGSEGFTSWVEGLGSACSDLEGQIIMKDNDSS